MIATITRPEPNQPAEVVELLAKVRALIDERDALKAELERAASAINYPAEWDTAAYPTLESAVAETYHAATCARSALKVELAARNVDAERYRWLRNDAANYDKDGPLVMIVDTDGGITDFHCHGDALDAAIDAARGVT